STRPPPRAGFQAGRGAHSSQNANPRLGTTPAMNGRFRARLPLRCSDSLSLLPGCKTTTLCYTWDQAKRGSMNAPQPCNVLMLYPLFSAESFWSFGESCKVLGVKRPAAPLGLITVAAML